MPKKTPWMIATAITVAVGSMAHADWKPTKPVEFIVTSSPGGGTDNFARVVQSIISKNNLMDQPVVVTNKGGGSGAEGYVYAKVATGDAYKLTFGTNNEYLLPYVAKLAYKASDLTPVAAMAMDEFLIWVNGNSEYKDAKSYVEAAKAKPQTLKMGGSQSKDTDQTLTSLIEDATGAKFIYVPFQGGGAAGVQLAGGHIDSNTNNPNENVGQWKAGAVKPLCVFSPTRLAEGPKVTADMGWADIPTCKEAGVPIDQFQMPRTVWLPSNVPQDAVTFYADLLKKVSQTPEWKEYIERTSQTNRFLVGEQLKSFIADDDAKNKKVFEREGWIVK
ncbi:Bug family tripartite tricarboxylate transporter substrate binding protein [Microvirga puerhi]|uniref:Tripartite tricarboxylate transporter substrate binding protein n=1 Tax=Microvirga puerhi TaxID=2876078 RepID=A0ABS7VIZ1_9HYPH|nr:tripartite tricarboxylate transporter substrate binding protein [Microvirga puerhi]MBZ6075136.1 tripartite tricarboxylate transporter substrate binding protein [Microvirga puerhi]